MAVTRKITTRYALSRLVRPLRVTARGGFHFAPEPSSVRRAPAGAFIWRHRPSGSLGGVFLYIQRSTSSKHGHSSLALLAKNPCKGTEGVSKRTGGTSGKPWKAAGTAKAVNRTRAYDNTRCIVILPSPLLKTALLCRPLTTGT